MSLDGSIDAGMRPGGTSKTISDSPDIVFIFTRMVSPSLAPLAVTFPDGDSNLKSKERSFPPPSL